MAKDFMETSYLVNTKLSEKHIQKIHEQEDPSDPIRFVIVGDLSKKSKYETCALLVTEKRLKSLNLTRDEASGWIDFSSLETIYNKRMYGNGLMRAELKDGTKTVVFRFTFSVAALCDAVIAYVNSMRNGEDPGEAAQMMEETYHRFLSVCPKCGRTLSAPGVSCINCMGKKKLFLRLFGYMKPQMPLLLISCLIAIVYTSLALLPPLLTKELVDNVLFTGNALTLPERKQMLVQICIVLIVLYVVRHGLSGFRGFLVRKAGDRIIAAIRCDVYQKAQYLPMRFYDKTSTGSVINRISSDTSILQSYMLKITQEVISEFFRMAGIVIIMLFLNWKLTLYSLIPVPLVVVFARVFRKKIAPFYRRIWRRSTAVTSVLTDTIPGIRVVKSFTNEKHVSERFDASVEEWRKTDTNAGKILNLYPAVVNTLIACGSVVIWGFGGNLVIRGMEGNLIGSISVGLLVSFISYATMFYEPVNFFANLSDSTQNAMASTERIMDILDAESEHDFGKGNKTADMGGRIRFKNVNFSFDRTKKVLKNINLTIEPGDIVGIVGTTGSGKSTLINLLLRYYDHYEGQITVGGVDIRNIDMQYYRSRIGYVQQEPMMFRDTIFNNISYGDDHFTTDEVIRAADIANAHEFIARQPDGYDSMLGERGVGLSGGERQRVSIARAMLRDPKMLVFDEATASVDSETEHLIQEAIDNMIGGRTTIMIAHRLSTLARANKIVVVDNGEIIECGTPAELMEKKGKYYRLVQIQSMSDKVAESRREERFE